MADSVYGPTRAFCDQTLSRFGVETSYYDPVIGAGITALMRPNTRAIFCESPGSLTFEIQDIPAIGELCRATFGQLKLVGHALSTVFDRETHHAQQNHRVVEGHEGAP